MTEKEAKKILLDYRECDDNGAEYGYRILSSIGADGNGFVFECCADGETEKCLMGVYPNNTILTLPT